MSSFFEVDELITRKSVDFLLADVKHLVRQLEEEKDLAICESTNVVNDSIKIIWERNFYKKALESIANFPLHFFDEDASGKMKFLAIRALAFENTTI